MKNIIIDSINYDVIDNVDFLITNFHLLYNNTNLAFNDGFFVLPITTDTNCKKPAFLFFWNHLMPINTNLIQDDRFSPRNIIDFNNDANLMDYINSCYDVRMQRENSLTTFNNIFNVNITGTEDPEKLLLKQAINAKNIDIYKYQDIIGKTFPNDLRELKNGDKMSLKKIKLFANALDLEIEMIIRNKQGAINPMNIDMLSAIITGGEYNGQN